MKDLETVAKDRFGIIFREPLEKYCGNCGQRVLTMSGLCVNYLTVGCNRLEIKSFDSKWFS
jgi:hypothetical protein